MQFQSPLVVFLLVVCSLVMVGAQNPMKNQSIPGAGQQIFYMNKASDCDGKEREVYQNTVYIFGKSSENLQGRILSCNVTLRTTNVREPNRFKMNFVAVKIIDPKVHFSIFDGELNGRMLYNFSSNKGKPRDLDFDFSTGQRVSFRLVRGELESDFDIRIVVIPVPVYISKKWQLVLDGTSKDPASGCTTVYISKKWQLVLDGTSKDPASGCTTAAKTVYGDSSYTAAVVGGTVGGVAFLAVAIAAILILNHYKSVMKAKDNVNIKSENKTNSHEDWSVATNYRNRF